MEIELLMVRQDGEAVLQVGYRVSCHRFEALHQSCLLVYVLDQQLALPENLYQVVLYTMLRYTWLECS